MIDPTSADPAVTDRHPTPRRASPARRVVAWLLVAGTALSIFACSPEAPPDSPIAGQRVVPPPPPPNFVLLVIDTLRADRIDSPSRKPDLTPVFDALRNASITFENARTTSSWTLPATASVFLSELPSQHGVSRWGSVLGAELTPLPDVLQRAGYRTVGWSANRLITPERGFRKGFDSFELVSHPEWKFGTPGASPFAFATGEALIDRAAAWLDARPPEDAAPFFLYLHAMEPHTPYVCDSATGSPCQQVALSLSRRLTLAQWDFSDGEIALLREFYDADVRLTDRILARLMRELVKRRLLANTWLIVTSDHGEMLGEHGLYVHGHGLHEEVLRVPLLIRHPDRRASVVKTPVSLIDVAPTILEIAGIEPPARYSGRSLMPFITGEPGEPAEQVPIVAELLPVRKEPDKRQRHIASVSRAGTKLVLEIDGSVVRFDLDADPGEANPLPAKSADFEALLREAGVPFRHMEAVVEPTPELTEEMRDQLKGLGYLHE